MNLRKAMQNTRPIALSITAIALTTGLGGCVSTAPDYITFVGTPTQGTQIASLHAGDTLGRSIHQNDVILAAKLGTDSRMPSLAEVDDEQD
jgi:hypothetical protein